jgi:beta-phosphoglucomutase-like phosphatase (HAD superfamily)
MISAVLFDLDRMLADSESLHCQPWQATLAG